MSFLYRRAWEIKRTGKHDKWKDEGGRRREYLDIASCALGTARGRNALVACAPRPRPASQRALRVRRSVKNLRPPTPIEWPLLPGSWSEAPLAVLTGGHQGVDRITHYGPVYCQVGRNPERGISSNTREETAPPPRRPFRGRPSPILRGNRLQPACRRARTAAPQLASARSGPPSCAAGIPGRGGSRTGGGGGRRMCGRRS